jgi:Sarcosine oxidase, delta subunit family
MMQIRCPYCGMRDDNDTEFSFGGEAHITRPAGDVSDAQWTQYLDLRRHVTQLLGNLSTKLCAHGSTSADALAPGTSCRTSIRGRCAARALRLAVVFEMRLSRSRVV